MARFLVTVYERIVERKVKEFEATDEEHAKELADAEAWDEGWSVIKTSGWASESFIETVTEVEK